MASGGRGRVDCEDKCRLRGLLLNLKLLQDDSNSLPSDSSGPSPSPSDSSGPSPSNSSGPTEAFGKTDAAVHYQPSKVVLLLVSIGMLLLK